MNTVVLFSSPNKNGNTGILLKSFLDSNTDEVNMIFVFDLEVKPCIDCKYCYKTGKCFIDDDMNEIYKKIESCDVLIIAAPVNFTSFPAPLKLVIDRFQAYWSRKFILKDMQQIKRKKGVLLMTSGMKEEDTFSHCEAMTKQFFSLVNAEFSSKIYAMDTDNYPVKSNENIKNLAICKGKELYNIV